MIKELFDSCILRNFIDQDQHEDPIEETVEKVLKDGDGNTLERIVFHVKVFPERKTIRITPLEDQVFNSKSLIYKEWLDILEYHFILTTRNNWISINEKNRNGHIGIERHNSMYDIKNIDIKKTDLGIRQS